MRKKEISVLNVLFCFFVVLIHLLSAPITKLAVGTLSWGMLFSLQRPLFCAVSGFIFLSALKTSLPSAAKDWKKTWQRLKKVWLPYLLAVSVYCGFEWITGTHAVDPAGFILRILTGRQAAHFYFVILISLFYLAHPLLLKPIIRYPRLSCALAAMISLATALLCNFAYYNLLFTRYLLCYVLGCIAGLYYDRFIKRLQKYTVLLSVIYGLTLILDLAVAILHAESLLSTTLQQLLSTALLPLSILFWYRVAITLQHRLPQKPLSLIDRCTYPIYLWHVFFILVAEYICRQSHITTLLPSLSISAALTLLGITAIVIIKKKLSSVR